MIYLLLWACGTSAAPVETAPTAEKLAPASSPVAAVGEEFPAPPPGKTSKGRLLAVGDLHGDRDAALATFKLAGIVDDSGHWAAGTATFVQTGDVVDRGPDSKGVIALLKSLQLEAAAAGGELIPLLGNHEVMNTRGDWRYVSDGDLAGYGGVETRAVAYARIGEEGAWLAQHDAVVVVDDTVFLHGGLREVWAKTGVERINTGVRDAMFDTKSKAAVLGEQGPLWFRGYAQDPEVEICAEAGRALARVGAKRMVLGHTVQEDGVPHARCGGKIVLIDTGISAHYGGHQAAIEIIDGHARALLPAGPMDLPDPK